MIEFLVDIARELFRAFLGLVAALALAALTWCPRIFGKTDPVAILVLVGAILALM